MAKRGRPPKSAQNPETVTPDNSSGPATFQRDEHGLLKNIQYSFSDDGSVNWRAMVGEQHLFPNRAWFQLRGKDMPASAEGLKDDQLLIKLGGIKELARLRGFSDLSYHIVKCEQDHVAVTCQMVFIPNYETGGKTIMFQDMANATLNNTHDFGQNYLETIACNRSFVRCVRNFLNIHIVGADEVGKIAPVKSNTSPAQSSLKDALSPQAMLSNHFNGDFEAFVGLLRKFWQEGTYKHDGIAKWNDFADIPTKEARALIKLVKDNS